MHARLGSGDRARLAAFQDARKDPTRVVLEGLHALKHAVRFGAHIEDALCDDRARLARLADEVAPDLAPALAAVVDVVPRALLDALSGAGDDVRVIAIARRPAYDLARLGDGPVVLLEQPAHPGNVGAVIRIAAAAGCAAVIVLGAMDLWQRGVVRGAAGLHFALPVVRVDRLPALPRPLLGLDPEGAPLGREPLPSHALIAFGNERHGLSPALKAQATALIALPMRQGVSSLNLAASVAATLYAGGLVQSATRA
ncbi:MAG: TrmH family RNA methyltransferase [Geminicoccaceae bacterium]